MQQEGSAPHLAPHRALALYLFVGCVWFAAGELVLPLLVPDALWRARLADGYTYLFVLATGLLAAWLVRAMQRAERARLAAMQEAALVLRHAPAGIARVDPATGQVVWANARLAQALGLPEAMLPGMAFDRLLPASDAPQRTRQLALVLDGRLADYQEVCLVRSALGQELRMLCTATALQSPEGAALVYVLQDLSELDAARAALERSESRLRLALDGSGSGVWEWDVPQRQYRFSQTMARLLHYQGEALEQDFRLQPRLHPEDRPRVRRALHAALARGLPFSEDMRLRCFDGSYRWFLAQGTRHLDAQGRLVRWSGLLTDQSPRRAEQERQRLASTVVENTQEGIVVTDADSRILSVNAAFTHLMGYSEAELVGLTPRVFKSGRHDAAFYRAMWESVQQTGHWRGEIWNRRKSGEPFPERMSLSAVYDSAGQVTHYVCMFTDISAEKAREEQLEFLAHRDALTGLPNRVWFGQRLERALEEAQASGETMAVLLLNLDRFKDVNDSYGHLVGDQVLQHIAARVQAALRPGDLIGRMAGDEVVVVARQLRDGQAASEIAERLIAAAGQPWHSPDGFAVVVGVSAGICLYPAHATTAPALLQGAHAAVYGAKAGKGGASNWCFFHEDMTLAARERIALEARLRRAVALGHLRLYYQPQIEIATGRIVGAEALVRWMDPEEGMISPARFIPVAETSGLIGPLGEWVLQQACRQGQDWRAQGLPDIALAVNVSLHQFLLTDLVGCTAEALAQSGFPAERLELEITESALAARPDEALQVLRRLRELGLRLAIDDFGTGYSSLAHLKRFPIHLLKIDQGFIRDIPHSADDMAISRSVIALGHGMGLQVLAEGVETAEQLAFLQQHGCDHYQGYLCSRPLPAEDFAALLRTHQAAPALQG